VVELEYFGKGNDGLKSGCCAP